ncbi:class I SAM-dependent methyltransferase [Terrimonas sp.]|uniref:class I SAM-dependent methyltransferase n=1 Tax=Terrimonas sp. TaxID=1914338 RepID=UPI00351A1AAF
MSIITYNYSDINKQQASAVHDPYSIFRYKQFAKHIIGNNLTILDIGCASGKGGKVLKECNPTNKIIGIDVVAERIDSVDPNIYDTLICGSATKIPLQDNSVDVVVAGEFIEHILPSDFDIILSEVQRVLNPDGFFLITTPNPNAYLVKMGRDQVLKDPAHVNILSIKQLKKILSDHSFNCIKIVGSGMATRLFGEMFPLFGVYGSYLVVAKT